MTMTGEVGDLSQANNALASHQASGGSNRLAFAEKQEKQSRSSQRRQQQTCICREAREAKQKQPAAVATDLHLQRSKRSKAEAAQARAKAAEPKQHNQSQSKSSSSQQQQPKPQATKPDYRRPQCSHLFFLASIPSFHPLFHRPSISTSRLREILLFSNNKFLISRFP
jgi:hypothetical protein